MTGYSLWGVKHTGGISLYTNMLSPYFKSISEGSSDDKKSWLNLTLKDDRIIKTKIDFVRCPNREE